MRDRGFEEPIAITPSFVRQALAGAGADVTALIKAPVAYLAILPREVGEKGGIEAEPEELRLVLVDRGVARASFHGEQHSNLLC